MYQSQTIAMPCRFCKTQTVCYFPLQYKNIVTCKLDLTLNNNVLLYILIPFYNSQIMYSTHVFTFIIIFEFLHISFSVCNLMMTQSLTSLLTSNAFIHIEYLLLLNKFIFLLNNFINNLEFTLLAKSK